MDHRKGLPRALQLGLGKLLQAHYQELFRSIPPHLLGLAQKIPEVTGTQAASAGTTAVSFETGEPEGLDPETVSILHSAYERAWGDLEHLTANPTTHKALAARLIELLERGERNPSRLATKAVLGLVAPKEAS